MSESIIKVLTYTFINVLIASFFIVLPPRNMRTFVSIRTGIAVFSLIMGLGMSHDVNAANASVTLAQNSPDNTLGQWIVTYPDGTQYETSAKTKVLSNLESGVYRVAVRAPERSVTNITLKRGPTVLQKNDSTIMTFELKDGEALRIEATYTYTGTVKVQSDPAGVPFVMTDANGGIYSGTTPAVFNDMSPVTYRVHYDVTRNCEVRKNQERVLIEGSSLIFYVNLNCGDHPISMVGKTLEPPATGNTPAPAPEPEAHADTPDARIVQTSNVSEVIPGGNMRFTISIRNITRSTLHNVALNNRFNPESLEITSITDGGTIQGENMQWTVPKIFAGQTWTTTVEARARDHLTAGDRIVLLAHATSDESDANMYPEAWSSVVGVGIAYMPQTGFRYDMLLALFALMGAAIATISTNRVQKSVKQAA